MDVQLNPWFWFGFFFNDVVKARLSLLETDWNMNWAPLAPFTVQQSVKPYLKVSWVGLLLVWSSGVLHLFSDLITVIN